jgi:hypothetical protein
MFRVAHQVADRYAPWIAREFLAAIDRIRRNVDEVALLSAVASGSVDAVRAALATGGDLGNLVVNGGTEAQIRRAVAATGRAGADVLTGVLGVGVHFNATDPRAVLYARQRAAALVVAVTRDQREAVRIILTLAQSQGLTYQQQARAVREIVGIAPPYIGSPMRLRREILGGLEAAATARRLSATDQAQIRSRIRRGTVTEDFADAMAARYAASLRNFRGLTVGRTESMAASNHGLRTGWKQAQEQGALPKAARRVVIVTPDDRLRPDHLEAGLMNRDGVPLDAPFRTPWGYLNGPPWDADPYNCRCSEGLIFPGYRGVL